MKPALASEDLGVAAAGGRRRCACSADARLHKGMSRAYRVRVLGKFYRREATAILWHWRRGGIPWSTVAGTSCRSAVRRQRWLATVCGFYPHAQGRRDGRSGGRAPGETDFPMAGAVVAIRRSRAAQHHSGLAAQTRRTPSTPGTEALPQRGGAVGSYNRYVARIRLVSHTSKFLHNPRQASGSGKDDASFPGIDRRTGVAISG